MSEPPSHAPGTPAWVELSTPDLDLAGAFYGGLFGWTISEPDPPGWPRGHRVFDLGGRPVAGAAVAESAQHRSRWTTSIATSDADDAATTIRQAGGTVLLSPVDVGAAGRRALFADPEGAVAGLWQPREHAGTAVADEPGAPCWSELTCRDRRAATAFYSAAFAWRPSQAPPADVEYALFTLAGTPVAGLLVMDTRWPRRARARWMTYFAVDDADLAVDRARPLGGTVTMDPFDTAGGRVAVLADPHGAPFCVIARSDGPPA